MGGPDANQIAQLLGDQSRFLNSLGERLNSPLDRGPHGGNLRRVRDKTMTLLLLCDNLPHFIGMGVRFAYAFDSGHKFLLQLAIARRDLRI